jgi:hypothetical protein
MTSQISGVRPAPATQARVEKYAILVEKQFIAVVTEFSVEAPAPATGLCGTDEPTAGL